MIIKKRLNNGMRIVCEPMEGVRSVSIGVWIGAGSIYEREPESGVSHFIEHMLFKGTNKRTASEIAEQSDAIGGNLNAFTSKECTYFYVKVIDENIQRALELLADIVCNPKLDIDDIEREKGVVLEEISMNEDSPEDLAHEQLCQTFYKGDPLADPVLGTAESVRAFTRETLTGYMSRLYCPDNMVLSAAGHFDPDEFIAAAEKYFSVSGGRDGEKIAYGKPAGGVKLRFIEKDIEQTHICLAFNGFPGESKGQYPLFVLNNAVGGSMSSRLFQSIRESNGLAYSVYSTPAFFTTTGYFTLYAGTGEELVVDVAKLMLNEYARVKRDGITDTELERAKNQLKSSYLLGSESTSAHASTNGRTELLGVPQLSEAEVLAKIDGVGLSDVAEILPTVCDFSNMTAVFVGRVKEYEQELTELVNSFANL